MGSLQPFAHGFLSPHLYLQAITMTFCRDPFQRPSSSESAINCTLSMPGARQLSRRSSLDQPQLTSLLYQQFDVLSSFHRQNSLTKLMAISLKRLCTLKFLFWTPRLQDLTSLFFSSLSPRGPKSISILCQWGELTR